MNSEYTEKVNELNLKKEKLEIIKQKLIDSIVNDLNDIKSNLDICIKDLNNSFLVDGESIIDSKISNDSIKLETMINKINIDIIPEIESEIKLIDEDIEYYNTLIIQDAVS